VLAPLAGEGSALAPLPRLADARPEPPAMKKKRSERDPTPQHRASVSEEKISSLHLNSAQFVSERSSVDMCLPSYKSPTMRRRYSSEGDSGSRSGVSKSWRASPQQLDFGIFEVPSDVESLDSKVLFKKVLQGLQHISEGQARLEDLMNHGANFKSSGLRAFGEQSRSFKAPSCLGTSRSKDMHRNAPSSLPSSIDEAKDGGVGGLALVAPRFPPPLLHVEEDEKVLNMISKVALKMHQVAHHTSSANAKAKRLLRRHRSRRGNMMESVFGVPVLHPNCSKVFAFDIFICFVLLHDICMTPFLFAWRVDPRDMLLLTAYIATVIWSIDATLGFFIAYFKDGELEMTQPKVAWYYFCHRFPIDLTLLMVDLLNLMVDTMQQFGMGEVSWLQGQTVRILKLTRLLKLARAARVLRVLDRMWVQGSDLPQSGIKFVASLVVKILIVVVISNHVLACLWFWQGAYGPSDTQQRWLEEVNLESAAPSYQYFTSYHWAVGQMTLGSSDVNPVNSYERFLNIIFLLYGLMFGSTTIPYVSAAIVGYIMAKRDVTNQLVVCRRFLRQYECPHKLAAQVVQQVSKRLSEEIPLTEQDVTALNLLAPTLRSQVLHSTRIPHLRTHTLFMIWGEIEIRTLHALSSTAVFHQFMAREDDLFYPGQSCDRAWFVVGGAMKYSLSGHSSRMLDEEVAVVNAGTWVCEAALWSQWLTVGNMGADDQACHLVAIDANLMLQVLQEESPTVLHLTLQYAKNYHACIASAGPPYSEWPTDLHVPFTEDVAMLLSQHVGLGLLKREIALGGLWLSDQDEAYLMKELVGGRCTLQYSKDLTLERVVAVANVMLLWDEALDLTRSTHEEGSGFHATETEDSAATSKPSTKSAIKEHQRKEQRVLYQIGRIDEHGEKKLALHVPGTKRKTGEAPQAALERIMSAELRPFKDHMRFEGSERVVTEKDGTQTLKMPTKTVKTVYKSVLTSWPEGIQHCRVGLPNLPGLRNGSRKHDLLLLPQSSQQVGLYAFLHPKQYSTIDDAMHADAMKKWIAALNIGPLSSHGEAPSG